MASNDAATAAIFEDMGDDYAESFRDRVRAIHEHFDKDADGYLNFHELAALQLATSGFRLDEDNYVMACRALECHPTKGISIEALRLTFASEGTNLEEDYFKIFPERKNGPLIGKDDKSNTETIVYEVGDDGVDISP